MSELPSKIQVNPSAVKNAQMNDELLSSLHPPTWRWYALANCANDPGRMQSDYLRWFERAWS